MKPLFFALQSVQSELSRWPSAYSIDVIYDKYHNGVSLSIKPKLIIWPRKIPRDETSTHTAVVTKPSTKPYLVQSIPGHNITPFSLLHD